MPLSLDDPDPSSPSLIDTVDEMSSPLRLRQRSLDIVDDLSSAQGEEASTTFLLHARRRCPFFRGEKKPHDETRRCFFSHASRKNKATSSSPFLFFNFFYYIYQAVRQNIPFDTFIPYRTKLSSKLRTQIDMPERTTRYAHTVPYQVELETSVQYKITNATPMSYGVCQTMCNTLIK